MLTPSLSKRSGLEKAIYQVEQALKRSKDSGSSLTLENLDVDADLRQLITSPPLATSQIRRQSSSLTPNEKGPPPFPQARRSLVPGESTGGSRDFSTHDMSPPDAPTEKPEELALNHADNPLQLLAMASILPAQSPSTTMSTSPAGAVPQPTASDVNGAEAELTQFFGSLQPTFDNSPDLDPIEMGLVTTEEAESLFAYFHERLAHTRWGLDPTLHTAAFVRGRSAFLFTSILAAAALFLPKAEALSKRLSNHRSDLARKVLANRNRSVEIVLAFMVNVPWMKPARHWADDETCAYLSMALTIALDLQLNKIVVPSPTIRPPGFLDKIAKAECIDAAKALQLDGFPNVDPTSAWGRRLLRLRERIWLALFVLDRGYSVGPSTRLHTG